MASSHHGKSSLRDQMKLTTTKHVRRPSSSNMLLKDYLIRDDLSSCSSNGFKSFPRRQCCSTVRFQKDLHAKRNRLLRPPTTATTHRSHCSFKVASSTISALHKASRAVINAVKYLPFPSISPSSSSSPLKNNSNSISMRRLLSKSFSRKMLSRSFWRKSMDEEEEHENETEPPRWKSFGEFLEDKQQPSDQQHSSLGSSNGNSWGSSTDFTWEILRPPPTDHPNVGVVTAGVNSTVEKTTTASAKTSTEDSTTDGGCTLEKLMDWSREEKEQLSPVSVLNGPFGDDEDINSPSDSTRSCPLEGEINIRGNKNKQNQKSRHHDDVASSLKPIDLEKRMAILFSESNDEKSKKGSDEKAWMMVNELETASRLNEAEKKLFLDLFNDTGNEEEVSKVVKEWISGESRGVSNNHMNWEVCVREMDKCERWINILDEQVGIQLELEVLTSLMNELVLELITS